MKKPNYTNSLEYQLMSMLCEMMRIPIKYENRRMAVANVDNVDDPHIAMPINEEVYDDFSLTLSHEIAHFLIEHMFFDKNCQASKLIELCCDQIGYGIYLMVEKIVSEADAYGEDVFDYMKKVTNGVSR